MEIDEPSLGLYLPDDFYSAPQKAEQYRLSLGKRIHILSFYIAWGSESIKPDIAGIQNVMTSGYVPMITWEPWRRPAVSEGMRPEGQPDFSLKAILSGKHDDYIRQWAHDLTELAFPVFFRPMHEMNGNWYPWCGTVNNNKPEDYIKAWLHIRSIFRGARNDKLIWVWSPYAHSVPEEPENEMWHYFPGTEEVDWLGLDGYNWGVSREWSRWQDFREIFERAYDVLIQMAPGKPVMIAEVGCAEEGGDKGKWIEEAFKALRDKFVRIKALVWFNVMKECDWRIESSQESLTSFRKNGNLW
ncbi:MAG: glycoside hydrolase family 26 protein [Syntrophales bacterium]